MKQGRVHQALKELGYSNKENLEILGDLVCLDDALTQGAPTSPLLSNIAIGSLDESLSALATEFGLVFTRYADDIVFFREG